MSSASLPAKPYAAFLESVKERIRRGRLQASRAVNSELISLYWDMGQSIHEKQVVQGWGDRVVESLALDLTAAFPGVQGFSLTNLWRMRQLYVTYSAPAFLSQVVREMPGVEAEPGKLSQVVRELVQAVPWGHHANLLASIDDPARCLFYLRSTAQFGWSRAVLFNQVKAMAYERSLAGGKSHNFPGTLPEHLAEQAEEALKSTYNLEFLGINEAVKERELEDRLIERLRDFILLTSSVASCQPPNS